MTKFCWFEYVSNDAPRAQGFFGELFGWTVRRVPMGDGEYAMIAAGDTTIGGYRTPTPQAPQHARWLSHLKVENATQSAAQAKQLGGSIIVDAFKLGEVGTMAVIAGVAGETLALWQPHRQDAPVARAVGCFCWNELAAPEPEKALAFYAALAGWTTEPMEMPGIGTYHVVKDDNVGLGGIVKPMHGAPHAWLSYVQVDACDASAEKAKRLGATVVVPPTNIPGAGRFAILRDPQGAGLGILQPAQ